MDMWTTSALALAEQLRHASQPAELRLAMSWHGPHWGGVRGHGHAMQKAYSAICPMLTTSLILPCTDEQKWHRSIGSGCAQHAQLHPVLPNEGATPASAEQKILGPCLQAPAGGVKLGNGRI